MATEFKSQICTTVEQSKRLLGLGLKPETADMVLLKEMVYDENNHCTRDGEGYLIRPIDYLEGEEHRGHIPAWSLHRLIEMIAGGSEEQMIFLPDPYDEIIEEIAGAIMVNSFNKEYLEDNDVYTRKESI